MVCFRIVPCRTASASSPESGVTRKRVRVANSRMTASVKACSGAAGLRARRKDGYGKRLYVGRKMRGRAQRVIAASAQQKEDSRSDGQECGRAHDVILSPGIVEPLAFPLHPRRGQPSQARSGQLEPVAAPREIEFVQFGAAELLPVAESSADKFRVELFRRKEQPEWLPSFGNAPRQCAKGHAMQRLSESGETP